MPELIERVINTPFPQVHRALSDKIVAEGFLLLHEINTQHILASHGIPIPPLRQLLFFHPSYLKFILDTQPLAVLEAPLKVVLCEDELSRTRVTFLNPKSRFGNYDKLTDLGELLYDKMTRILDSIE